MERMHRAPGFDLRHGFCARQFALENCSAIAPHWLKFGGGSDRRSGKIGSVLGKNFPDFPDILQESLDIVRDMTKMTVVLSSAMQAGAVALELNRWAPPKSFGFALGEV